MKVDSRICFQRKPIKAMAIDQTQKYCKTCKIVTLHSRPAPNHILHLLITILICGLWIPVWILSSMRIGGWRCQQCGSKSGGEAIIVLAIIMVVIALPFCYTRGSDTITNFREKKDTKMADQPQVKKRQDTSKKNLNPEPIPESQPTPQGTESISEPVARPEILDPDTIFLETLENIKLPVTIRLIEPVSLLDATGREVSLPKGTNILVDKRSAAGTLTIRAGTKTFVGNETRIARKFRLLSDT